MNASTNREMLILARELRGMTQSALANAAGIDQALISRYENEIRDIPKGDVVKIAAALGFPPAFFYRSGRYYGPDTSSIYHRKRQSISAKVLKTIYAKLNQVRIDIERLLEGADIDSPYEFPRYDIEEYEYDISLIATNVRTAWRIPNGPVQSIINAIEDAGGIVFAYNFGTNKIDAVVQWIPPIPPIFLVNSQVPGDRLRFTLAHEIGHLVMHFNPTQNMEEEADTFASAFLMPEKDIGLELTPAKLERFAQLKPKWKVSMQALIRRARDLKQITDGQYKRLNTELSKMGYKIREPNPIPQEKPRIIQELIEVHIQEHGYSAKELAKIFCLEEWETRSTYLGQPSIGVVVRQIDSDRKTAG